MTDAAPSEADRIIGEVLASRYRIEHRLGEGAMGTVYKAHHVKVGRAFAVKVLHPRLLVDAKVAQRFEREAELAGRLRHPNVIGVVDVGETTDGLRYMVMDFANGRDLATLLEEAPMPPARIIHLVRQLLEGLYHAHEAGLIHRDFKPENVIVERDDHGTEVPRIVDFGIAILREGGESPDGTSRLTTNGLVLGTPHYMAPEQAVADPIDHRIDLFALGIVIYEMLSGRLPFDGNGAEVARANLMLEPPPISVRVPHLEVDPLLEAFMRQLLAKKRDQRPASAKAARELLDLIDRDRAAAAAALGVALEVATRAPQATEPLHQQRPDPGSGELPLHAPAPAGPRASKLEAPPVGAPGVGTPRPGSSAQAVATAPPAAATWTGAAERRRRHWLIGGIAVVVAAGAIVAVATTQGDDQPPATVPDQQLAIAPPELAPDVVAPEAPPVEPAPIEAAPPEPAPPEPAELAADEAPAAPPIADVPAKPPAKRPARGKTRVTQPAPITRPTTPPPPTPATISPPVTATPPAQTVKPTTTAPAEITAAAFASQYSAVGRDLSALGGKAGDLWARYRLISYQKALGDAALRRSASAILTQLQRDIASRK